MRQYRQIISVCILMIISNQIMCAETDYFIQNVAVDIIKKMCKSSQLPIKVSQTDALTAMDISDGYLTYYCSSNLQGEELDYVMNNKKLIYDNLLAQIVSTPFTTALCIDAKIGIRYRYTFTYNGKDMDIDITNSTLTDILPNPLNQDVRNTYVKEHYTATGAPCQISNDYFTIYQETSDASYLTQYLDEKDMAELVIDSFLESTPGSLVNLLCLWLGKGFCISFVDEKTGVGKGNYISYDKIKEIYLSLYPSSLSQPSFVDKSPKFLNGGADKFSEWVNSQLIYPKEAMENGIQGRVILTFKIGKDGYIKDIQVIGTPDKLLANEAVRVVSGSPQWTPGEKDNQKVSVSYTFPVIFQLQ